MTITIGSTPSGLEWSTFIPIILLLITFVGGGFAYWWQKSIDREEEILLERRRLYREFVSQVQSLRMHIFNAKWGKFDEWYYQYKEKMGQIFVTAPDTVVQAIIELDKEVTNITHLARENDPDAYNQVFNDLSKMYFRLVVAMRKDTFGDTEITPETFSTFSEYYVAKKSAGK